jgi:hypothetical protein
MPTDRQAPDVNDALEQESPLMVDCDECRVSVEEEDSLQTSEGDNLCQDCYDDAYGSCDDCGDEIRFEDSNSNDYGNYICQSCFDDNYDYCNDCDEQEHRDNMQWDDRNDAYVCNSCYEDRDSDVDWEVMSNSFVRTRTDFTTPLNSGYSMHKGKLIRQTDPNLTDMVERRSAKAGKWMKDSFDVIKSKRNVGIELEINLDRNVYDYDEVRDAVHWSVERSLHKSRFAHWYKNRHRGYTYGMLGYDVVSDSSVTSENHPLGCEVVLAPRRGDIIDADVRSICEGLQKIDAYVSSNCGIHLHIDTSDFDYHHFSVLATLTKMIEPHVYTWLPSSRRNSRWAQPVSQTIEMLSRVYSRDEFIEAWYDGDSYYAEKYHEKRYHGLNLHCHFYANQGSEIRYHSGSLNADKIKHWVVFWTQVFDTAYRIGETLRSDNQNDLPSTTFYQSLLQKERLLLSDAERRLIDRYRDESLKDYNLVRQNPDLHILYRKLRDYYQVDTNVSLYAILTRYGYKSYTWHQDVKALTFNSMMNLFDIPKSTRDYYYNRYYNRRNDEYFDHNHLVRCYGKVTQWYHYSKNTDAFVLVNDDRDRLAYWNQSNCRRMLSRNDFRYSFQPHEVADYIVRPVDEYVNDTLQSNVRYSTNEITYMEENVRWLRRQYANSEDVLEPPMPF